MPTPAEWNDPEYRARLARYGNPVAGCPHWNQTFDRSLCPDGWMHTYCDDCNRIIDGSKCCRD